MSLSTRVTTPRAIKKLLRSMRDVARLEASDEAHALRKAFGTVSAEMAVRELLERTASRRDPLGVELLYRIDVMGERVDDVAADVGRSRRQIFRLRASALKHAAMRCTEACADSSNIERGNGDGSLDLLARAVALDASGDIDGSRLLIEAFERRTVRSGRPLSGTAAFGLAEARFVLSRREGNVRAARDCVHSMLAHAGGDPLARARAQLYRAEIAIAFGEPEICDRAVATALESQEARDDRRCVATVLFTRANQAFSRGDFSTAAIDGVAALHGILPFHRGYAIRAAALASRAALMAGWDWEQALCIDGAETWYAVDTFAVRARYALRNGDPTTARRAVTRALKLARHGHLPLLAYTLATAALVERNDGHRRRAELFERRARYVDSLMPHAVIRRDLWWIPRAP